MMTMTTLVVCCDVLRRWTMQANEMQLNQSQIAELERQLQTASHQQQVARPSVIFILIDVVIIV